MSQALQIIDELEIAFKNHPAGRHVSISKRVTQLFLAGRAGNIDRGHIVYYRASKKDHSVRLLKPKCTRAARKITRDLDEEIRNRVRAPTKTEAFRQSLRERKKMEMRFAHIKRSSSLVGIGRAA